MAYEIYITDALVCGTKDSNTSDRSYLLFTRDAGMIWASAKSVREERSKHRYALQDFSVIRVSLVRGKAGWRITGTEPEKNLYFDCTTREARGAVRNMLRFLRRFLHGETPVPEVFDDIVTTNYGAFEDREKLETTLMLRALGTLGYIAPHGEYDKVLEAADVTDAYVLLNDDVKSASDVAIAHALDISHL